MSDAAAPVAAPVKAKKATKPKADKKPVAAPTHPTYAVMIKKAIAELKERSGSSKAAITKYILANYKVGDNVKQINAHLRLALKRGVATDALKQTKGTGASGSFKLGEKKEAAAAKPKVVKKTVAKKEKKPAAEKKAVKPKAKKTTTKPKAAKSPKKVKAAPKKAAPAKKIATKKAAPKKKAAKSA